jgi:TRAP-type C4-dicarboxylate transport system substrate-binding protein
MKRLSVLLSLMVVTLLVVSLAISCTPKPKETIVLRLVVPSPPGDMLTVKDEELAARFNERAGGDYEIKVFAGGQLVEIPEYLDAVRTGAVEMMDVGWGIYGGADPKFNAHEAPFLFNNIRAHAAAQDDLVELFDPVFRQFNQTALTSFTTDSMVYFGNEPVKTMEDWDGLLVGAISPVLSGMIEELGGAPVTVMWTDLYTNLEKGVIDSAQTSTQGIINLKLTDVISYVTIFFGSAGQNGYTINLDVWNAMPQSIQDLLLEETKQTAATMGETFIRLHDEDAETLRGLGIDVYILPKAEQDRWKETCSPYVEQQLSAVGDFGVKVKQIADEANSQFP